MKSFKKISDAVSLLVHYPVSPIKRLSVWFDIIKQYRKKGVSLREYYNMEFEKQSELFRKSFLGFNEELHYLEILNPIKFYALSYNKYLTHKVLNDTGVRTSELLCYYQPDGRVYDSTEIATCLKDVYRILREKEVKECVIKSPEGSHGANVYVVKDLIYKEEDIVLVRFDNEQLALSSILNKTPLIFESLVHQTEQFSAFNKSSVNTVRFMTTLWPDGTARIIATFIKIGREGKCVDNAGDGGNVDVCVDVDSGEIKYAIQYDGWRKTKDIEQHPDNGQQLNGVIIENWSAVKDDVKKYQQAFPYCRAAGWDIAITNDGPVVLEVNDRWDVTGQLFIRKGWRKEIRECYLAWKKENRNDGVLPDYLHTSLSKKHLYRIEKDN